MPLVYEKLFAAVAFKIQLFSISERFMLILILIFTEKLKDVKKMYIPGETLLPFQLFSAMPFWDGWLVTEQSRCCS